MYVIRKTEQNLWTVGFYTPSGEWVAHRDCDSVSLAEELCNYLNGGNNG